MHCCVLWLSQCMYCCLTLESGLLATDVTGQPLCSHPRIRLWSRMTDNTPSTCLHGSFPLKFWFKIRFYWHPGLQKEFVLCIGCAHPPVDVTNKHSAGVQCDMDFLFGHVSIWFFFLSKGGLWSQSASMLANYQVQSKAFASPILLCQREYLLEMGFQQFPLLLVSIRSKSNLVGFLWT